MRFVNNHQCAVTVMTVLCILKVLLLSTRPEYEQYDNDGGHDILLHSQSSSSSSSSPPRYYSSSWAKDQSRRGDDTHWQEDDDDVISKTNRAKDVVEVGQQQQQVLEQTKRPTSSSNKSQEAQPYHSNHFHDDPTNNNSTTITSSPPRPSSDAPLFLYISPGTTGSTFIYHSSCIAGFPSVHHKSFCISQRRGIGNVSESVVEGVRVHFKLIRLYSLATECCKLHGRARKGTARNTTTNNNNDKAKSQFTPKQEQLCSMPLHTWASEIHERLTSILQSGVVGLFDAPYPFLVPKVLQLAKELRSTPPIIAMIERNPREWAISRNKNHGLLVCKTEYSYGGLGESEFDLLGCYERAMQVKAAAAAAAGRGSSATSDTDNSPAATARSVVHNFWDIFQYRSRAVTETNIDPTVQLGMERNMKHHQDVYLPKADYAPDMFGVHSSVSSSSSSTLRLKEEDVVADIRQLVLARKSKDDMNDDTIEELRLQWRDDYTESLTCRARVNWDMDNDTLVEFYHIPKLCPGKDDMIPLINTHDIRAR